MTSVLDVKKRLSAVWAKESDKNEKYEFDLAGDTAWGCIRSNGGGSSRFKLQYDPKTERLWWGQSYFLDPADLEKKPDKVVWYRASDPGKKKGAFTWIKIKDVHLVVNPKAQPKQFDKSSPTKGLNLRMAGGAPTVSARPTAGAKWQEKAPSSAPAKSPTEYTENAETQTKVAPKSKQYHGRAAPEVILDLKHMSVIYKPPFWKCELPEKGDTGPKGSKDLILLRWIKEKLTDIDAELFDEDFNPALSGTGFGPLAHRIDGETSGLLLVCKTSESQKHIKAQFHKTKVSKRYICLVHGRVKAREGVINASIRTVRTDTTTRSEVSSTGEWAETKYQVVATYSGARHGHDHGGRGYSLVACNITTGRTHQIRVHMLSIGHPLVSDPKYLSTDGLTEDRAWCPRLFLHSYRLVFKDLSNEDVCVVCPLPNDLKQAVMTIGAADDEVDDDIFGETSWQREVLRPSRLQWRPGTGLQRKVAEILGKETDPVRLDVLNGLPVLRDLMNEESISGIGKPWLMKHWEIFEIIPEPGSGDVCVRLRAQAGDEDIQGIDLDWQIESVQSEIESLQQQKQRAIAEEEYQSAAEIKRRVESVTQQLESLSALRLEYSSGAQQDGDEESGAAVRQARMEIKRKPKAEVFKQDVKDETLFPSLGGGPQSAAPPIKSKPRGVKEGTVSRDTSVDSRQPAAVKRDTSVDSRQPVSRDASVDGRLAASDPMVFVDLKEALFEFLLKREGYVAHINEINNDRYMRGVMRAQQPKPITAVTKGWLNFHEGVFVVLTRSQDMYVALDNKVRPQAKAQAKKEAKPRDPNEKVAQAYHQVVQRMPGAAAPTLVYNYSAAAQKEERAKSEERNSVEKDGTSDWTDKFLLVLKSKPQRYCSIDELLEAVPEFAKGMGARKLNEQRALLLMFLQSCSEIFQTKKEGFGPDRKVNVYAK